MTRGRVTLLLLMFISLAGACAGPGGSSRDLRELVVQDSTYLTPETMLPYTGPVFRAFPGDSSRVEIEGALVDGAWHGDFTVYHPSGRIRYLGSFAEGERCGPWTEAALDIEPVNLYAQLLSDIESMAIYPPCPPDL